jgi:hemerythrin-like domain-containing protein
LEANPRFAKKRVIKEEADMSHPSLEIIRAEHRSIATVLQALLSFARAVREKESVPDFKLFRAMLYYLDVFPERLHHPKEDQYLFAKLRSRADESDEIVSRLEREHNHGELKISWLMQAVIRLELEDGVYVEEFIAKVEAYALFYSRHMGLEEELILPLAETVLTDEDWVEIDTAFLNNSDPLFGIDAQHGLNELYKRILSAVPQPVSVEREMPAAG